MRNVITRDRGLGVDSTSLEVDGRAWIHRTGTHLIGRSQSLLSMMLRLHAIESRPRAEEAVLSGIIRPMKSVRLNSHLFPSARRHARHTRDEWMVKYEVLMADCETKDWRHSNLPSRTPGLPITFRSLPDAAGRRARREAFLEWQSRVIGEIYYISYLHIGRRPALSEEHPTEVSGLALNCPQTAVVIIRG